MRGGGPDGVKGRSLLTAVFLFYVSAVWMSALLSAAPARWVVFAAVRANM